METPKTKYKKSFLIELVVLSVLFGFSFLFPMCTFYYLGKGESIIEKPQYANSFKIAGLFIPYFLMVLLALLSGKKVIVHIVNILVLLSTALTYFLILLSFTWSGGPFHPDLNIGFSLINLFLLVLIIRSYMWIGKLQHLDRGLTTKTVTVFSVVLPIIFISWVLSSYFEAKKVPIKRAEWVLEEKNNRIVKMDSWDYVEGYNAYADEYYSKPKADSLKNTFVLDSVRFTFFNDKTEIEKRFTVKAKNGKLDVEEILDSY